MASNASESPGSHSEPSRVESPSASVDNGQPQGPPDEGTGLHQQALQHEINTPNIEVQLVDSFEPHHVHQALIDFKQLYGPFFDTVLEGMAAATGTNVAMRATLLPGVLAGALDLA